MDLFEQPAAAQSLLEFTSRIANAVNSSPGLRGAWVTAEMIDLRQAGGHCYMELIEKDSFGRTVAKIRAMIWRNALEPLRRKFWSATGRDIANNLKVMVRLTASHHPLYGTSATITDIDPSYTLGDLERLRREILERLHREGILERNKNLPFPAAPQRIAVISSPTAAGYGDFINQLEDNRGGYVVYPKLFDAVMQGDRTSLSVRQALQRIEMVIDLFDCVVIIRGGGATTDMNGFDDYDLAKAVAEFPLPVVVGIGHERDRCVLDEIACRRCKTPTAVASFLIDSLDNAMQTASRITMEIARYSADRLEGEKRRLDQDSMLVPTLVQTRLQQESMRLSHIAEALPITIGKITSAASARLDADLRMISASAGSLTANARRNVGLIAGRLSETASAALSRQRDRLSSFQNLIVALSPENTLRRGYSVTRVDGHAVTDASSLPPGTRIETILLHGKLTSTVTDTMK
ncbi:MAG: exodeoxyribonuclease VII large subunit [Muribaculum sp.]|nr:exodeoxyribonuclease VII large subunit [Muribaculum sp.]